MRIERLANDTQIVTHLTAQQSLSNEHVDFRFAQLDYQAAKPLPAAFPVPAHALSGGERGGWWVRRHFWQPMLPKPRQGLFRRARTCAKKQVCSGVGIYARYRPRSPLHPAKSVVAAEDHSERMRGTTRTRAADSADIPLLICIAGINQEDVADKGFADCRFAGGERRGGTISKIPIVTQ
jgi:hypothetical protein